MPNPARLVLAAALTLSLGVFTACESQPKPGAVPATLDVTASQDSILAGETVTFNAKVANTYGRDADIEWTTTGGDLDEVKSDRVAQVTFDEAGQYKVSADLLIDGKRVATDIEHVSVKAIR